MKTTKRFLHWLFDDFLFSLYELTEKKYTMGVISSSSSNAQKLFTVPTNLVPPVLPFNVVSPSRLGDYYKMFGGLLSNSEITTKVNPDTIGIQELHFQYTVRVVPATPLGYVGLPIQGPIISGAVALFSDIVDNTSGLSILGQTSYQMVNTGTAFFTKTAKVLIPNASTIPAAFRWNIAQTPSTNKYFVYIQSANNNTGLDNRITVSVLQAPNFPIGTLISAPTGSGATGTVVANNAGVLSINNMSNGIFAVGDVLVGGLGPGTVTLFDPAINFIAESATTIIGGNVSYVGSFA